MGKPDQELEARVLEIQRETQAANARDAEFEQRYSQESQKILGFIRGLLDRHPDASRHVEVNISKYNKLEYHIYRFNIIINYSGGRFSIRPTTDEFALPYVGKDGWASDLDEAEFSKLFMEIYARKIAAFPEWTAPRPGRGLVWAIAVIAIISLIGLLPKCGP